MLYLLNEYYIKYQVLISFHTPSLWCKASPNGKKCQKSRNDPPSLEYPHPELELLMDDLQTLSMTSLE